jgi:hypothetical protein
MIEHSNSVGQVPTDLEVLPRQSCAAPILCSGRLGPSPNSNGGGTTQAVTTMGRPFIVSEVTRPGSYRLTQMDDTEVGNSWNIEHLRKLYP